MDVRFRPYTWTDKATPASQKRRSPFSSTWTKTLEKLEHELRHLKATEIIIEAGFTEAQIRLDGWPRADQRPNYGGVKISFNQPGVGRVEYPCDSCVDWRDNVHSIALGLEALRAIDRYGIAGRLQQYTGFRALESGSNGHITTRTQAAFWIADQIAHREPQRKAEIQNVLLGNYPEDHKTVIRIASKVLHPDTGGSDALWKKFEEARKVLGI